MTIYFVSAVDGNNADTGADWANAKQTVAGALAIAGLAAGDAIYVDNAGTFTAAAAITWTLPAFRIAIVSVNRAGGDAWTAGAIEAVGAASAAFTITQADGSSLYVYGMQLDGGTNSSSAADVIIGGGGSAAGRLAFKSCKLRLLSTSTAGAVIHLGPSTAASTNRQSKIDLDDCEFTLPNRASGNCFYIGMVDVAFVNPTFVYAGAGRPTPLFAFTTIGGQQPKFCLRDGDASGFVSGALFDVTNFTAGSVLLKNLKLHTTPTLVTGTWPNGDGSITLRNVDSADTINTFEYHSRLGDLTETASVYATGGASFNAAGIGWQIVTTAACDEGNPFVVPALFLWNTATSAQTATVEIANNSATALTDREIWLELSYPASAAFPNYANDDDRNANPFTGTAANQATSTNGWTGLGGTNTQQKLTVAFTAAEVGLLEGRVAVAKASQTLFLDPKLKVA